MKSTRRKPNGIALAAVIGMITVLMILLPVLVSWLQQDTKASIKTHKSTLAFNLAEAGVDRGMWKLKSSTSTFATILAGDDIAGYNFDQSYVDITGGNYRIQFSSGPGSRQVTVLAEGRDSTNNQVRAIRAIYRNQAFPGAVIAGGLFTWKNHFSVHWGPVLAHGNIEITDNNAAQDYFPRKFSRQVVTTGFGAYARDTNGLTPPNTDNVEWWSDYPVPELPILDFATLKTSATITATYNLYGCNYNTTTGSGKSKKTVKTTNAPWSGNTCSETGSVDHSKHLQNTWNHPLARKGYTWYWDGDVGLTGDTGSTGNGIWGNIIVRGNMTNFAGDNYSFKGPVPENAWQEYVRIQKAVYDTGSTNEYPADNGLNKNRTEFNFGGETWTKGHNPPIAGNTDVAFRGLLYVGGDLLLDGPGDIFGAVYVVGDVENSPGNADRTLVFYDETLDVPTLNVVLVRQSWDEVLPSNIAWP